MTTDNSNAMLLIEYPNNMGIFAGNVALRGSIPTFGFLQYIFAEQRKCTGIFTKRHDSTCFILPHLEVSVDNYIDLNKRGFIQLIFELMF